MKFIACFLGAILFAHTPSKAANWQIDVAKSSIHFTAQQAGEAFTGHFNRFTLAIGFDPDAPSEGTIHAEIDLSSVEAGSAERNQALPGQDWFFAEKFPVAIFKSNTIQKTDSGRYEAHGTLTLRGISRTISLPFKFHQTGVTAAVEARASLDRSLFGVGTGVWADEKWVKHRVQVDITIMALQTKAGAP